MKRETLDVGILAITASSIHGRPIRDREEIEAISEKVFALLRSEKLPICQVKDVMALVCDLADLEQLR